MVGRIRTNSDCDHDLMPDECEMAYCPADDTTCQDCNNNGIPDGCDIADCPAEDPSCQDCNDNGLPDWCDIADCPLEDPSCEDCNHNGVPDGCDIADCPPEDSSCQDCDGDGLLNGCETNPLDKDCDNDSICNGEEISACSPEDPSCQDCNGNGAPDGCESGCETDSEEGIPDEGEVTLNPGGGSDVPTEEALVTFTNESGSDGVSITVNETIDEVHGDSGGLRAFRTTLIVDASLNDGEFSMTISIPFDLETLDGADPLSVDLACYDAGGAILVLAVEGNTENSPGHDGLVGDRDAVEGTVIPTLSGNLGDYGVFWNPVDEVGFVWANVDHVSDFAPVVRLADGLLPASSPHDVRKNRYIAFNSNNRGPIVIQVQVAQLVCGASGEPCSYDLDCPNFGSGERCLTSGGFDPVSPQADPEWEPSGWLGEPCRITPSSQVPVDTWHTMVVSDAPTLPGFAYTDPGTGDPLSSLFVSDCEIMPRYSYSLRARADGNIFTERLVIGTIREPVKNAKKWADVVGQRDADTGEYTEPNQRINVDDVQVTIVFLNSKPYRPHLTMLDLSHEVPDYKINADDLQMIMRAFSITEDYPPLKFQVEASGAAHPRDCPFDAATALHDKCE